MSMQAILQTKGITYALNLVGGANTYQKRVVLIIALQHLFRSFLMMYYPYLNQAPTFLCRDPDNPDIFYDCFENNGGCDDKVISPNSPSSLAIDLGLYCEFNYIRTLAGTFFFLGGNIGAAYFSYLSDKKGRKASLMYSYILGAISLLLLGTATLGPVTYIVFLMMIWASMNCFCSISLTYVAEVANEEFSKKATAFLLLGITVGEMIIVGLAYAIPSWKTVFLLCIAIPALLTVFTYTMLDETPVYYYTKKEYQKACEVLEKIAEVNKKQILKTISLESPLMDLEVEESPITLSKMQSAKPEKVRSWNYLQIILHSKLRLRVLMLSVIKLYLCMAYFGSIFALSNLGGSIYTNSIVAACAEALGYCLSFKAHNFSTSKLLKRSLQIVVMTGVSFLLIPSMSCSSFILCNPFFMQSALALILRTCICFMYGFIYSLANDLFPPEVRSQSIGISDIFSALGGMVSPFIILIAETHQTSPLFLFGVLGFSALLASKHLPETKMTTLDEPDEDVELKCFKALATEVRKTSTD